MIVKWSRIRRAVAKLSTMGADDFDFISLFLVVLLLMSSSKPEYWPIYCSVDDHWIRDLLSGCVGQEISASE